MDPIAATKLVQRPDGTEQLLLRQARITVKRGPDRGKTLAVDRPRVRIGTAPDCELPLTDESVSRYHLALEATEQGYVLRDLGSTNGTHMAGIQLVQAVITGPVVIELGQTRLHIAPSDDNIEIPLSPRGSFGGLLGQSLKMRQVFAILERVADGRTTVLLEGESGTGKEVAAQAMHQMSSRREGPFVVVDCGAIPPTLIESELFGHARGAFTGAQQARVGLLEQSHGGTLFLDEVGELPLEMQPRLLRFLESQEVKPVGDSQHRKVDVRVLAATNRRLLVEVNEGRFRQDLFYRLSVVCVEMPPLRDRPEDVVLLARHFAEALGKDPDRVIAPDIASLLAAYAWPGNVRELRNVVERVAVLPELATRLLEQTAEDAGAAPPTIGGLVNLPFHEARRRWQDTFEQQYLATLLTRSGNVVKRAAEMADLPRQTFHRLLRQHGVKEP